MAICVYCEHLQKQNNFCKKKEKYITNPDKPMECIEHRFNPKKCSIENDLFAANGG